MIARTPPDTHTGANENPVSGSSSARECADSTRHGPDHPGITFPSGVYVEKNASTVVGMVEIAS